MDPVQYWMRFEWKKNTDVRMHTLRICTHCCTTGGWDTEWKLHWYLYNRNNGWEMWEMLLRISWQESQVWISCTWETVTLRSELVKCHSLVCIAITTFRCQLGNSLTLIISSALQTVEGCVGNWDLYSTRREVDLILFLLIVSFWPISQQIQHFQDGGGGW